MCRFDTFHASHVRGLAFTEIDGSEPYIADQLTNVCYSRVAVVAFCNRPDTLAIYVALERGKRRLR